MVALVRALTAGGAGTSKTLQFLAQVISKGGKHAGLARKVVNTMRTGKPFKFTNAEKPKLYILNQNFLRKIKPKGNPNVFVREELMVNPYTNTAGRGYYSDFTKTPMIDIDLPIGQVHHMASQMRHGFKTKSDVMKRVNKFLKSDEGSNTLLKVYDTPGGVRAFDLSQRVSPATYNAVSSRLGNDPSYAEYILNSGKFGARLSPKPGRIGDYGAKLDDTYGYGKAISQNVKEVSQYHDDIIKQIIREQETKGSHNLGGLFDLVI